MHCLDLTIYICRPSQQLNELRSQSFLLEVLIWLVKIYWKGKNPHTIFDQKLYYTIIYFKPSIHNQPIHRSIYLSIHSPNTLIFCSYQMFTNVRVRYTAMVWWHIGAIKGRFLSNLSTLANVWSPFMIFLRQAQCLFTTLWQSMFLTFTTKMSTMRDIWQRQDKIVRLSCQL